MLVALKDFAGASWQRIFLTPYLLLCQRLKALIDQKPATLPPGRKRLKLNIMTFGIGPSCFSGFSCDVPGKKGEYEAGGVSAWTHSNTATTT